MMAPNGEPGEPSVEFGKQAFRGTPHDANRQRNVRTSSFSPYVAVKREQNNKNGSSVCVALMEVTKCRDAREAVLPVYLLCE
jgi:hypothetical protein